MNGQVRIENDVLQILKESEVSTNTLTLPRQLDRKLYVKVAKIIELIGGKWNKSAKCHVFTEPAEEIVESAVVTGFVMDLKKLYQFYETPDSIAGCMVQNAQMTRNMTVLEPSAGHGAIIRAIQREFPGKEVFYCEIDEAKHAKLPKGSLPAWTTYDFLKINPDWTDVKFDRVLMNPPFRGGYDIAHIQHAHRFLKPGGRMVAISSPSWQFRTDRKFVEFRDWLGTLDHDVDEIPEGSFAVSGTNIRTLMLTIGG